MVDVICGWEKVGIKMDFLQVLPYVFLILFLPAWGHPISYLPSWEILDGFPGFTLEGVDPSPPLRLIPNNFYWDCPLLMTCVKPPPHYFLSIQFLCLLVLLNFLNLKLSCLFSYILFYFKYTESSKKVEPMAVLCMLLWTPYVVPGKLLWLNTYLLKFFN